MASQARSRIFRGFLSRRPRAVFVLSLLLGSTWSGLLLGAEDGVFSGPSDLVATMPDPYDVDLRWQNHATADGGNMVEFQLHPQGASLPADERDQFLILAFSPLAQTAFRHGKLEGETVFSYRIHPYFGPCTAPVHITTGSAVAAEKEPDEPEGPLEEPGAHPESNRALASIRATRTLAGGAPTNVTLSLSQPTHVVVRWHDHAADADGYLVEISRQPDRDFQVCALLPPHTTSFRKIGLPPATPLYLRVRVFFYGMPSNVVTKTTGPDPVPATETKP